MTDLLTAKKNNGTISPEVLFINSVARTIPGMINEREVKENVISTGLADLEEWEVHHIYSVYRDNAFYDKNAKINSPTAGKRLT